MGLPRHKYVTSRHHSALLMDEIAQHPTVRSLRPKKLAVCSVVHDSCMNSLPEKAPFVWINVFDVQGATDSLATEGVHLCPDNVRILPAFCRFCSKVVQDFQRIMSGACADVWGQHFHL